MLALGLAVAGAGGLLYAAVTVSMVTKPTPAHGGSTPFEPPPNPEAGDTTTPIGTRNVRTVTRHYLQFAGVNSVGYRYKCVLCPCTCTGNTVNVFSSYGGPDSVPLQYICTSILLESLWK